MGVLPSKGSVNGIRIVELLTHPAMGLSISWPERSGRVAF